MYREQFRWKEPPYEYVFNRNPFDVISGTTKIREAIDQGASLESIVDNWQQPLADFKAIREEYLIY
jgi:uncharacterized protein YbbC (DUF1343 family)